MDAFSFIYIEMGFGDIWQSQGRCREEGLFYLIESLVLSLSPLKGPDFFCCLIQWLSQFSKTGDPEAAEAS